MVGRRAPFSLPSSAAASCPRPALSFANGRSGGCSLAPSARSSLLAAYHSPLCRAAWLLETPVPDGAPVCLVVASLAALPGPLLCRAHMASSSRRLCRRALGRTGCRVAGLGHRHTPAPSLGEGFSRELLALTALPSVSRCGWGRTGWWRLGGWAYTAPWLRVLEPGGRGQLLVPSLWSLPEATPASP